jgi:hypothetical protein
VGLERVWEVGLERFRCGVSSNGEVILREQQPSAFATTAGCSNVRRWIEQAEVLCHSLNDQVKVYRFALSTYLKEARIRSSLVEPWVVHGAAMTA